MRATLLSIVPKSEWRTFSELAPGPDGCLVVSDRFLFLSVHIAKVSQPARQPIDRLLVGGLNYVNESAALFPATAFASP